MDVLLRRPGPFAGTGFTSTTDDKSRKEMFGSPVLVVGAGGLGCELLKDLALLGFTLLHVIDMDTIDVSNLNRQFLFTDADVGKPKAVVAARRVMQTVPECTIIAHHARLQQFDSSFYSQFAVVVCGLDSVEARRCINAKLAPLNLDPTAAFAATGMASPDAALEPLLIPLVDGGTEGFKGQARVIIPGVTACYECSLEMQTKPVTYPICTIANTPRLPEHCVQWAVVLHWPSIHGNETPLDGDDPKHVNEIMEYARARAEQFGVLASAITFSFAQGIIKNIIPAIASTNAIVAAACAAETVKLITNCSPAMNNYMMYIGDSGIYTHTFALERRDDCVVCNTPRVTVVITDLGITLGELLDILHEREDLRIKTPSVTTTTGRSLYMTAPASLEEATRKNLSSRLVDLLVMQTPRDGSQTLDITNETGVVTAKTLLERTSFLVTDKTLFDATITLNLKCK